MNEPILTADALVKHYPVKETPFAPAGMLRAVDGVDLTLREGETLGLAGESGCGKSTVGKLLMGLIPPTAGTISFRGRDMREFGRSDWGQFRREVQMIFQDPYASLNPRMRIGDVIAEPLAIHRLAPRSQVRDRVLELMRQVGLREEHYDRYPHEFSGGQRQRAGIARALAVSPRLIIADEPVSALDLSIQAQIINLLEELKSVYSLSFIFVAHDLSVVRHISDRIAIMYLGRIMETGSRDQVFDRFLHPYTECLLSAIPQADPERRTKRIILKGDLPSPVNPPSGCPFHTRCPYAEQVCIDKRPPLEEKEQGHRAACHFSTSLYRGR